MTMTHVDYCMWCLDTEIRSWDPELDGEQVKALIDRLRPHIEHLAQCVEQGARSTSAWTPPPREGLADESTF